MKVGFRLFCILAASAVLGGYSAPSKATPICDGTPEAVAPYLPELPRGCQRERI